MMTNNNYDGALAAYNQAVTLNSEKLDAYYYRGVMNLSYGNTEARLMKAQADFSTVAEVNPNFNDTYYNRALCRIYLSDFSGAVNDLNAAIQTRNDDEDYYYNRGYANWKIGNTDMACSDFNITLELNPSHEKATESIAFCNASKEVLEEGLSLAE